MVRKTGDMESHDYLFDENQRSASLIPFIEAIFRDWRAGINFPDSSHLARR
jgi:hypothetical protein